MTKYTIVPTCVKTFNNVSFTPLEFQFRENLKTWVFCECPSYVT